MRFFPALPPPLAVMAMSAIRGRAEGNIMGKEVASLPLVREERHVCEGVSVEEIWREYETARRLLEIAEICGDEFKAKIQRERVEMLEEELKDAVMCDYEDLRGWC